MHCYVLPNSMDIVVAHLQIALEPLHTTLPPRDSTWNRWLVVGEGSAACILGLVLGGTLLAAQTWFADGVLESILSFNSSSFFT